MRFLILAHLNDDIALRVFTELKSRHGLAAVRIASNEEIALAPHWLHQLQWNGCSTLLRLADGTSLDSGSIGVVLNRLLYPEMPHFQRSAEVDRNYASMEMYSLLLSWLSSLPCPVVNAASPRGLAGAERSQAEWMTLARMAGLPTHRLILTTSSELIPAAAHHAGSLVIHPGGEGILTEAGELAPVERFYAAGLTEVFIVGERLVGEAPRSCREGLMRLRELAQCDILKVTLASPSTSRSQSLVFQVRPFFDVAPDCVTSSIATLMELREKRQ